MTRTNLVNPHMLLINYKSTKPSDRLSTGRLTHTSLRGDLRVTYALTYTVLQVVPKELLLMQTTNATVDNVPGYQVIAYNTPETLPEPYFEDCRVFGPEAVMPHINPDRPSLTSLMKCIVSLYLLIIRFTLLRI